MRPVIEALHIWLLFEDESSQHAGEVIVHRVTLEGCARYINYTYA